MSVSVDWDAIIAGLPSGQEVQDDGDVDNHTSRFQTCSDETLTFRVVDKEDFARMQVGKIVYPFPDSKD